MKKKNEMEHLVDVIGKWVNADETTHECFCVFAVKNEDGEELLSRVISGNKRIISALISSMETSEATRKMIMTAAKTFAYMQLKKMLKDKDITLN